MTVPRAFTADDTDERVPSLLVIIMIAVRSERAYGLVPQRILLDSLTYQTIAAFIGGTVDELFGLPVHCNLNSDAQPITVESKESGSRPHG